MKKHQTVHDYIPIALATTEDAFAARYDHPFLFGREVLEEEFRFQTAVTNVASADGPKVTDAKGADAKGTGTKGTDVFRIRHWVIPVKKPEGSPGADRVFLGRAESNDICVPHKTISKLHAYFVRDPQITTRWFLVDTGSANGTKTNGLRVPERARIDLVDGDTVSFGRCVFQWMSARALHHRLISMAPGAFDTSDD